MGDSKRRMSPAGGALKLGWAQKSKCRQTGGITRKRKDVNVWGGAAEIKRATNVEYF